MTVAREVVRRLTIEALKGNTIAGDRVKDSELGPVEDWIYDEAKPVIVVYTDDSTTDPGSGGERDLFGSGTVDLIIEIMMTQRMQVTISETGENAWVWDMPPTDAAMEMTLGWIERQVISAISHPANEWAELWRGFVLSIGQRQSRRGNSARDGVRFAGRQIVLPVTLIRDPAPGAEPSGKWLTLLQRLDSVTGDLAAIANVLRMMISPPADDAWRQDEILAGMFNLSADEIAALQVVNAAGTDATFQTLDDPDAAPVAGG